MATKKPSTKEEARASIQKRGLNPESLTLLKAQTSPKLRNRETAKRIGSGLLGVAKGTAKSIGSKAKLITLPGFAREGIKRFSDTFGNPFSEPEVSKAQAEANLRLDTQLTSGENKADNTRFNAEVANKKKNNAEVANKKKNDEASFLSRISNFVSDVAKRQNEATNAKFRADVEAEKRLAAKKNEINGQTNKSTTPLSAVQRANQEAFGTEGEVETVNPELQRIPATRGFSTGGNTGLKNGSNANPFANLPKRRVENPVKAPIRKENVTRVQHAKNQGRSGFIEALFGLGQEAKKQNLLTRKSEEKAKRVLKTDEQTARREREAFKGYKALAGDSTDAVSFQSHTATAAKGLENLKKQLESGTITEEEFKKKEDSLKQIFEVATGTHGKFNTAISFYNKNG